MGEERDKPAHDSPWGLFVTLALTCAGWILLRQLDNVFSGGIDWIIDRVDLGDDDLFGLRFSVLTCLRAVLCVGLVVLLIRLRRGPGLKQYLGLHRIAPGTSATWLITMLVVVLAIDCFRYAIGRPLVVPYDQALYETAYWRWLLVFALVVAAPLAEEILFRGFLFAGVSASRLGRLGAVFVSAAVWSAIHTQYGYYGHAILLALGLLLGWARFKTGSLYAPLVMHALNNTVAVVEMLLFIDIAP